MDVQGVDVQGVDVQGVDVQGVELLPLIQNECSLEGSDLVERLADWRAALSSALVLRRESPARVVAALPPEGDLSALLALCEAEVRCCSFFTFSLGVSSHGRTLTIEVPPTHSGVLDQLSSRDDRA